jgi:hypothetical protein
VSHAMQHATGTRGAWVQYNKSDTTTLRQRIKFMEDGPEKEEVLAKAALNNANAKKRDADEANELALIKSYRPDMIVTAGEEMNTDENFRPQTEDEHKMCAIPSKWRQLRITRSAKNKAVNDLKKAGDLQGAEEASKKPASTFKLFAPVEQKCWN